MCIEVIESAMPRQGSLYAISMTISILHQVEDNQLLEINGGLNNNLEKVRNYSDDHYPQLPGIHQILRFQLKGQVHSQSD